MEKKNLILATVSVTTLAAAVWVGHKFYTRSSKKHNATVPSNGEPPCATAPATEQPAPALTPAQQPAVVIPAKRRNAKTPPNIVREWAKKYKDGMTYAAIAKKYDAKEITVYRNIHNYYNERGIPMPDHRGGKKNKAVAKASPSAQNIKPTESSIVNSNNTEK